MTVTIRLSSTVTCSKIRRRILFRSEASVFSSQNPSRVVKLGRRLACVREQRRLECREFSYSRVVTRPPSSSPARAASTRRSASAWVRRLGRFLLRGKERPPARGRECLVPRHEDRLSAGRTGSLEELVACRRHERRRQRQNTVFGIGLVPFAAHSAARIGENYGRRVRIAPDAWREAQ